jgi:hypothetical protein
MQILGFNFYAFISPLKFPTHLWFVAGLALAMVAAGHVQALGGLGSTIGQLFRTFVNVTAFGGLQRYFNVNSKVINININIIFMIGRFSEENSRMQ